MEKDMRRRRKEEGGGVEEGEIERHRCGKGLEDFQEGGTKVVDEEEEEEETKERKEKDNNNNDVRNVSLCFTILFILLNDV